MTTLDRPWVHCLIGTLEMLLAAAFMYLEHLAHQRPLVMRHLYTLKNKHVAMLLTPFNRTLCFLMVLILFVLLLKRIRSKPLCRCLSYRYILISLATLSMLAGLFLDTAFVYSYATFTLIGIWGFESLGLYIITHIKKGSIDIEPFFI